MNAQTKVAGYLVDLDGTLMSGGAALPGAVEFVRQLSERIVIVSNDSEHIPEQLAQRLRAARLPVPKDRIVLAGTAAVDSIASTERNARVMLIGSMSLRRYARRIGLQVTDERPDIVMLARDRRFTYAKLAMAINAVNAGARLIVSNPDYFHPSVTGALVPETGALAAALLACTGPIPYQVVGKPEPALFLQGLEILGIGCDRGVVIGDNPDTDGAGARRLGLEFVHVRPGAMLHFDETTFGLRPELPRGLQVTP